VTDADTDTDAEIAAEIDEPFTVGFLGYAPEAGSETAHAYEDAVLPLLEDHGARIVYRGCRAAGEDEGLPLEVQILSFPGPAALAAFLADERRAALRAEYGEVFARTEVVRIEER
jgi:hypothetical protein